MPEAEVESFVHFAGVQLLLQNALGKLAWGHQREIAPERKQQDSVDPGAFEQAQFFRSGRE